MSENFLKLCTGEGVRDRQGAEKDCGRLFTAIHDIIGGNLPDDLCRELEELREKCPFCVDTFIKTLEKTVEACNQLPGHDLSDNDRADLRRKVHEGLQSIRNDIDNC